MRRSSTKYDYPAAEVLYCNGMGLKEIGEVKGIPLMALRQYAVRHKWTQRRDESCRTVSKSVLGTVQEHAQKHVKRMLKIADIALDHIEDDLKTKPNLRAMATLAQITDTFDQIARRSNGLAQAEKAGPAPQVNVLVMPPAAPGQPHSPPPLGTVIDIHAIPSSTDSNPDPIEPGSNAS